jgi:ABC-2 type transport system ATP-binding protein
MTGNGPYAEARVYPERGRAGSLTRDVAQFAGAQPWKLEEMHTEEGRLDEVFRAITLPDTVKQQEPATA